MDPARIAELRPSDRAAVVTWCLAAGERLRLCDVVRITGISRRSARELLAHLETVLPIAECDGVWRVRASPRK